MPVSRFGDEILVNTATQGDQMDPQITTLVGGGFVVVWSDGSLGVGGASGDSSFGAVKAQVFTAEGVRIGGEILVNTATEDGQGIPEITALENGGFVVTWQDNSRGVGGATGDFSQNAVKAQVFASDGSKVGDEILVNSATQSRQMEAQVSALEGGGFVVTWHDWSNGVGGVAGDVSGSSAVKAQVFDADGSKLGGEILVNTATQGSQNGQQITALKGGGFIVVWGDGSLGAGGATGDSNGYAIKAQVFAFDGTKLGGEILVNTATQGNQQWARITALENGGFVVAWLDWSEGVGGASGDSSGSAIKAQVFAANGATVGGEILVNTASQHNQELPEIIALEGGGFVVTWTDRSQGVGGASGDSNGAAVKVQLFAANGVMVGGEILVNSAIQSDQWYSQIEALEGGGFVVVWQDNSQGVGGAPGDTGGWALKAQVFAANGDKVGGEILVNTSVLGDQGWPRVSALDDGGFAVVWEDYSGIGGIGWELRAQIFTLAAAVPIPLEGFRYPVGKTGLVTEIRNDDDYHQANDLGVRFSSTNEIYHLGEDWNYTGPGLETDQSVFAIADGEVVYSGFHPSPGATNGFGNLVVIRHTLADGLVVYSLYAHLGQRDVGLGAIDAGDPLGTIGATGATDGVAHLHFEIFGAADGTDWQDYLINGIGTPGRWGYTANSNAHFADEDIQITNVASYTEGPFTWYNPSIFIDEHRGQDVSNSVADAGGEVEGSAYYDSWTLGGAATDTTVNLLASGIDVIVSYVQGATQFVLSLFEAIRYAGGAAVDTLNVGNLNGTTIQQETIYFDGGGGDDVLYGSATSHRIVAWGGDGADTLQGGGGDDTFEGGVGGDTLNGGAGADAASYADAAAGVTARLNDAAANTGEAAGDVYDSIENLIGSAFADTLAGDAQANAIQGGAGVDTVNGNDGADVLEGGGGNDTLDGGNHNDTLYGGDNADTLYGRAGNDTLDGGAGSNTLEGGAGDDTYIVRSAGDVIVEIAASGTDHVISTATRTLGDFLENLTLTGVAAINGFGNILGNVIIGNDAANTLNGVAGADTLSGNGGADTLNGGDGNDILNGGADNDLLDGGNNDDTLNGGDGDDTLYGRTQNDTLNGDAGADTLIGGDGDDVINGGADNDLIDGLNHNDTLSGGDGDDEMYGRQNNDTLNGDAGADTLYGGDGDDTLNGGDGDDFLDASNGVDVLNGGDGADTLYGRNGNDTLDGGLGADTLYGGNDADTFVFSTALGGGNIDVIGAFSVVDDTIQLDVDVFTAIDLGALAANAFVIGAAATDADDRIIYDPVTGALYYDSDGDGAGAAVQFASLAPGLALTSADFVGGP